MPKRETPVRISKDQPILERARRSAARRAKQVVRKAEADFWRHFDLEKFARDWRRGVGKRPAA